MSSTSRRCTYRGGNLRFVFHRSQLFCVSLWSHTASRCPGLRLQNERRDRASEEREEIGKSLNQPLINISARSDFGPLSTTLKYELILLFFFVAFSLSVLCLMFITMASIIHTLRVSFFVGNHFAWDRAQGGCKRKEFLFLVITCFEF